MSGIPDCAGLLIVCQLYRFSYTRRAGPIVLTAFDVFVVVLFWHKYGLMRYHISTSAFLFNVT
jgi:uncharacterized membrane protein